MVIGETAAGDLNLFDRSQAQLELDIAEGLPPLYADQRKLKQILLDHEAKHAVIEGRLI